MYLIDFFFIPIFHSVEMNSVFFLFFFCICSLLINNKKNTSVRLQDMSMVNDYYDSFCFMVCKLIIFLRLVFKPPTQVSSCILLHFGLVGSEMIEESAINYPGASDSCVCTDILPLHIFLEGRMIDSLIVDSDFFICVASNTVLLFLRHWVIGINDSIDIGQGK